ncbi:MAG TPA: hypothetical protein VH186_24830 [Chloroflexia bacterium]|nr:hypothetical protein [Chloroflexia bacterium]
MAKEPSRRPGTTNRPDYRTSKKNDNEMPGILGFMARNSQLLGWINLVAAILLLYFTLQGFLEGLVFLPFGFGLMGIYFFYSYVRNSLRVNFGKLTVPFNLVLLLGALICLIIGVTGPSLR